MANQSPINRVVLEVWMSIMKINNLKILLYRQMLLKLWMIIIFSNSCQKKKNYQLNRWVWMKLQVGIKILFQIQFLLMIKLLPSINDFILWPRILDKEEARKSIFRFHYSLIKIQSLNLNQFTWIQWPLEWAILVCNWHCLQKTSHIVDSFTISSQLFLLCSFAYQAQVLFIEACSRRLTLVGTLFANRWMIEGKGKENVEETDKWGTNPDTSP